MSQLIWREFFYTMSVNNAFYAEMDRNEICINIPWYETSENPEWSAFVAAKTGFPFIDAGMRQLYKEGWIHHIVRNALACFLTRGKASIAIAQNFFNYTFVIKNESEYGRDIFRLHIEEIHIFFSA